MKEKPIIINLFGGPSVGKSTTAAAVFSLLKMHDVNVEYVTEFAKDCTWEKRFVTLEDQYYVCMKQYHRIWRVQKEVDVIITDSPLPLGLVYGDTVDSFKQTILEIFNNYNNMNFLLQRVTDYIETGRNQTLPEACVIDNAVKSILDNNKITYSIITSNYRDINNVVSNVLNSFSIEHMFMIHKG